MTATAFASVVLDVDSTLCGIEGIDWLAERRGPEVGAQVADLTDRAMRGEIALEAVYGERLAIIRPTRAELVELAIAYERALAPGAEEAVALLLARGVRLVLVSGGIRQAIAPLAFRLGVDDRLLHAVSLRFDDGGAYAGVAPSPLTTQDGKPRIVAAMIEAGDLARPVLAVGDGATDALLRGVADRFAAYTGFVRRGAVIAVADREVATFAELTEFVCGTTLNAER